jgi:hypothetical protein
MDIPDTKNENGSEPALELQPPKPTKPISSSDILDLDTWKTFFNLTGGSLFYCLSAVFVAYGIVKVMGPILSGGESLLSALPCILTLHIYEIALLGVLILIVSKKVVDDAVSVVILMALFLVGTSIALGSVADKGITPSFFVGLVGIVVAFGKFYSMKRFARVPFGVLSVLGLGVLMACNYLGPVLMARSISIDPSQELTRRGLWMFLWVTMLVAAGIVLIEAMRGKYQQAEQNDRAFLQSSVMVYVFALILLIASGVHQYSMAYTFALERVFGDFVPLITVATLLLLEILRHNGKRFGFTEIVISCVPLAAMLLAINEKTVIASAQFGFGLICYPPVFFVLSGLAVAAVAIYHRWYRLLVTVFFYGLGVILTFGFSPEYPYDLNIHACVWTLVIALLVYGIVIRNQFSYLAGIVVLCIELVQLDSFSVFVKNFNLTEAGSLGGIFGLGCMAFYLIFGQRLHKVFQIVGALCLAAFVYDYLPDYLHWSYIIALPVTGCLLGLLWFRRKDIVVMAILCVPFLIKLYIMAKRLANWRFVILGFLLLAAGTVTSLLKRPTRDRLDRDK